MHVSTRGGTRGAVIPECGLACGSVLVGPGLPPAAANGEPWQPGMTVPEKAWRCRFRKSEPAGTDASALASLMAAQLLPVEAVK
ncbi:hypothetical protein ACU62C_22740 [Klebsiella aerogenes]